MTAIVGLVHDGKVYMGCDSAAIGNYSNGRVTQLKKVFKVGEFLIGYTTSFRMGQILQHHLEVPLQVHGQSDDQYMVVVFIEAVRKCLKDQGFTKVLNNTETGGTFLVGYRGALYSVDDDFQCNWFADGYDACGCGLYHALGAMAALDKLTPEKRIRRSLEIAEQFCPGVCGPFHIEMLG